MNSSIQSEEIQTTKKKGVVDKMKSNTNKKETGFFRCLFRRPNKDHKNTAIKNPNVDGTIKVSLKFLNLTK